MRVVVTGGSGLAGRHIVEELVAHDYEVLSVDSAPFPGDAAPFKLVDLTDLGQSYGALSGAEAVVHMAAIPRPTYHTNEVVFRTNVLSTYNVLEVAASTGISRVILASSMSVLGYPFFYHDFSPDYVPIDEEHPRQPQDPYALSKVVGEVMADAFVRRSGITIVSLRLAWIHTPQTFKEQLVPMRERPREGATNLWGYIDARDAARACRLALEANISGHEACFISAPDTFMDEGTSAELVRTYFPSTEIREDFEGRASLFSTRKAKELLGFEPRYTWQSYFEEEST